MKKIIIASISPQLFTSKSKIALNLLNYLSKDNLVASVSWLNDNSYLEKKEDNFYYNNHLTYPISNSVDKASVEFYEINNALKSDIVISIGSIEDIEFICGIKALNNNAFKWIHYLTDYPDSDKIEVLKFIDKIIVCNHDIFKGLNDIGIKSDINYFTADNKFINKNLEKRKQQFMIMNSSKNNSISNLGCFIEACYLIKDKIDNFKVYLNTSEEGDIDVKKLIKKYNLEKVVELPNIFTDYNNGISEDDYINKLNECSLFVDCSCQSSINLCALEAMFTNCCAATSGNVICGNYSISGVKYISYNNKELFMCSPIDLSSIIYKQYVIWHHFHKQNKFIEGNGTELGAKFVKLDNFNNMFKKIIEEVLTDKKEIKLDIIK